MNSMFSRQGPLDINFLIKNTLYTSSNLFKKFPVTNAASLKDAKSKDITFFDNIKYIDDLNSTKASFCLIRKSDKDLVKNKKLKLIFSSNPLLDFIIIIKKFYPDADTDFYKFDQNKKYLNLKKKSNTLIDKKVKIGKNFTIGANSVIKKNVIIGNNVKIGSCCVISNAIIGNDVIINDGTVVGKIGFGFKMINKKNHFIPHIGCVNIDDNVYIGSNCTIDRGSFSNTHIGKYSMIDNQVHLAHNVIIGSRCFIAGQVGIAGSTKIGNNCLIGGKAGISGHLIIGDNVQIAGQTGVLKNLCSGSKVIGYPATSVKNFLRRSKIDK